VGSRYRETDRLSDIAWKLFAVTPPGWARVQAICDYVHGHIAFGYEHRSADEDGVGGVQRRHRRLPTSRRTSPAATTFPASDAS
jgi:transglutaminase-like putative cysteine protease